MPADHCDDTRPYVVAYFDNTLSVTLTWTWDGVSTPPGCDGPANSLRVRNLGTRTYWALLPNARRGPGYQDIPPGTDRTITGNTLRQLGLDTFQDIAAVELTDVQPA